MQRIILTIALILLAGINYGAFKGILYGVKRAKDHRRWK